MNTADNYRFYKESKRNEPVKPKEVEKPRVNTNIPVPTEPFILTPRNKK